MKKIMVIAAVALLASLNAPIQAQSLKVPAPSPLQTIKQSFALSEVSVEYSRPSMKGRTIYGELVPFDKIWRTGANASTKITFGEDVTVEGNKVPAGTYALYTIPGKTSWEMMLYKDLKLGGGVSEYKKEDELCRFKVKPSTMGSKLETFTMSFSNITNTTMDVELLWELTRASFKVTADIDSKIMADIEKSMAPSDKRPYSQAASYYYENDKDLNKALEWIDKAIESNPKAYWNVHTKAKIQMKLNDNKAAIETANKSLELAKADGNDDYVKLNTDLIAKAKMMK